MKFSFGIITSPKSSSYLKKVIKSIKKQNIPEDKYEIVVVGGNKELNLAIFATSILMKMKRQAGLQEKNLITLNANFENIVYIHDYIKLSKGWYKGFLEFGNDFEVCINKILNYDDTRYRDWTLWTSNENELDNVLSDVNSECLIPYEVTHLSKFMYISGAYWVAKKLMENFPLDENLAWGEEKM